MTEALHTPQPYDYRQYDRVWQRVAPNLEPYPGWQTAVPTLAPLSGSAEGSPQTAAPAAASESQLPGAEQNPCCMGSAAAEMLEVIQGFIETELGNRRFYLAFSRQAPAWARMRLRELAADAGNRARRLLAVYYLITGSCYQVSVECGKIWVDHWCPALRERYHAAACDAMNYIRAAEGTTDPCLARLLTEMGQEEYRHADMVLSLLERGMQGVC